jgi:hypothetical protein
MRGLIDQVAHVFTSTEAHLTVDRHLLFLCGGSDDTSLRKQFLTYAAGALPSFRVFLAESAAKDITDFGPPTFLNLNQFEQFIADFSDCVVVFLESPGAFAEIGLFSHIPSIRDKLLAINNIAYQTTNSFINYGPLAEVNAHSILRPVLYLDPRIAPINFTPIQERLLTIFATKYRRRFVFSSYDLLLPIARLGIVLVIVQIFSPISFDDIFFLVNSIFRNANTDEVKHLISLTVAVGYVHRVGDLGDLFSTDSGAKPLLEFRKSDETSRIRIAVIDLYREHFGDLYDLLSTGIP